MDKLDIEIAVLLYNRAYHAIQVFESLKNNGVNSFTVFFDYADTPKAKKAQGLIEKYLKTSNLNVKKHFYNSKMGLAKAVVKSVSYILKKHDAVIFLEDDCLTRSGAIRYFKDGLNSLHKNKIIRSISGYTYPINKLYWGKNSELLLSKRFSTWGWATWSDRWLDYKTPNEMLNIIGERKIDISTYGNDIAEYLKNESYINGENDVWSITWILEHFISNSYSVFPRETYIENIGMDGTGVHCKNTNTFDHSIHRSLFVLHDWHNIDYYPENELIIKRFMEKNSNMIY